MGRVRSIPPKFKTLVYIKQAVVRRVVAWKVYNLSRLLSVMPSFREIRDLLLLLHGSNFISEEELLVFYEEYHPANLSFPHSSFGEFDLDDMEDDECLALKSKIWRPLQRL